MVVEAQFLRDNVLMYLKSLLSKVILHAHSSRMVSISWAFWHQDSVTQLCQATTWFLVYTFYKIYQMDY